MKKYAALCLILASLQARADLVITQQVDTGGQVQTNTMKIKGNLVCTEGATHGTIIDTNNGDLIIIDNAQKTYMKINGIQRKELEEKMQALTHSTGAAPNAERPKLVDTGRKEKVNGYDAEIYTAESPLFKFTYWVSSDYPNAAALHQQMKQLEQSVQNSIGSALKNVPDTSTLDGIILKTQTVAGGRTITTTLLSIKDTPVDDADFQVPAGYTEKAMRGIGGGASTTH